ncbi:T9SS type A sorting domain-containing protein [bacterium]|nr:T9SS type A sorting domain-containing protein [bacterium]
MLKRWSGLILVVLMTLLIASVLWGQVHNPKLSKGLDYRTPQDPFGKQALRGRTIHPPSAYGTKSPSPDRIIGEIDTVGASYYDMQANSTIGRMIALDSDRNVHVAWMCGYNPSLDPRHIHYNFKEADGDWLWPVTPSSSLGGIAAEGSFKAGYNTIAVNSLLMPFPAFHQRTGGAPDNFHTGVSTDWGYLASGTRGGLMATEPPYCYDPDFGVDLKMIWPKIAVDMYDDLHVIGNASTDSFGTTALNDWLCYWKGTVNTTGFSMSFTGEYFVVDRSELLAPDIATAPSAEKVAIGYIYDTDTSFCNWTNHYNIGYTESQDLGETWSEWINVTNYGPRPVSHSELIFWTYDETDAESVYVYTRPTRDLCIYYDSDNMLHLVWTEIAYTAANTGNPCDDSTVYNASVIKHWSEATDEITDVTKLYSGRNFGTSMASNLYRTWPCAFAPEIAEGPDGALYVSYQIYFWDWYGGYMTSFDDSLYYVQYDVSEDGIPNQEVFLVRSDDGGLSWGPPINVTNSHTPYAAPDSCDSELDPSMALVVDDFVHLLYVLDTDAGAVPVDAGTVTYNPIIYHKVPTSMIPGSDDCAITFLWDFDGKYFPFYYTDAPEDTFDFFLIRWDLHCEDAYQVNLLFSQDDGATFDLQGTALADSIIGLWWQIPGLSADSVDGRLALEVLDAGGHVLCADTTGTFYVFDLASDVGRLVFSRAGIIFDSIAVGTCDTASFMLLNPGSAPVEVMDLYTDSPFSILGTTEFTLDAGDEVNVMVTFCPTDPAHLSTVEHIFAIVDIDGEIDTTSIPVTCGYTLVKENTNNLPEAFTLNPNFPNPFNASTTISFAVDEPSQVELTIYNIKGEIVSRLVDSHLSPGYYRVNWDGTDRNGTEAGSGIFLCRLSNGTKVLTQKMTLLK